MQKFEELKEVIAMIEADVQKFNEKGNKSAGTRIRQAMQNVKKLAQEVRTEIQDKKKGEA